MHIISLNERPELVPEAATWFAARWHISTSAYLDSMQAGLTNPCGIPKWYLAVEGEDIVGGCGLIANDFHDRPDLTPNLCALWVDEDYRCRGIAGRLLQHAEREAVRMGIDTLYLVTDHTSFYERYGWQLFTMVQGSDGNETRMYQKVCKGANR